MPSFWVSGTMQEDYRVLVEDVDTPEEAYDLAREGVFGDTDSLNQERIFNPYPWTPEEGVEESGTVELVPDEEEPNDGEFAI